MSLLTRQSPDAQPHHVPAERHHALERLLAPSNHATLRAGAGIRAVTGTAVAARRAA